MTNLPMAPELKDSTAACFAQIQRYEVGLRALRRMFHSNPEHAYKEIATSQIIATQLKQFGVDEVHTHIAKTGVVAVIRGTIDNGVGRSIGLRAEMDALAICEQSGLPWSSTNNGYMHACGHDGHMAILLGVAQYLATHRNFSGTVVCIFQPAEEGGAGARAMIESGLLERFPLDAIYAIHNAPWVERGQIVVNPGAMMAAADRIKITVKGTGGHGGMPQFSTDAILASAHLITAIQTIVSRRIDPVEPAVISLGAIAGGNMNQYSVLPAQVELIGTVRTHSKIVQEQVIALLEHTVQTTCAALSTIGTIEYTKCYPATINHPHEAKIALATASIVYGPHNVFSNIPPSTSGEDFAFFLEKIPGAYIWVGQGGPGAPSLHSPIYDFDDRLIPNAVALLINIALQEMQSIDSPKSKKNLESKN